MDSRFRVQWSEQREPLMPNVVLLIVAIVVISAVVGAIAQFLNKLNEAKSPEPRRAARAEGSSQTERRSEERRVGKEC